MNEVPKETKEGEQRVIDAFHMMWELHPAPVMLIKANRTIVALNEAAKAAGIMEGQKCFTLCGPDRPCSACEANLALRDKSCRRLLAFSEAYGRFLDTYWTPVAGTKDLFIHYANDITECVREDLVKPGGVC